MRGQEWFRALLDDDPLIAMEPEGNALISILLLLRELLSVWTRSRSTSQNLY